MIESTILPQDRVTIVGVLNVTPDSFSDGGRFTRLGETDLEAAVEAGLVLARQGAHVIDVGGESTRPGAATVCEAEEIARTAPVVEGLVKATPVPVSIDTRKPAVAEAALERGARIVNDVSGLRFDPRLAEVAARYGAGLILGHLRGEPATMQRTVVFEDVVEEVAAELGASAERARRAGIPDERLAIDPGIGFGKRLVHNLELLAQVQTLRGRVGLPMLVGPSRKSFLGELTGDPVERREAATLAACAVSIFAGADGVRVHDVASARRAAVVARALRDARGAAS